MTVYFVIGLFVLPAVSFGLLYFPAGSVARNLVFLFPGVNLVAVILEGITVGRDPWGYRLGYRLARTQVVAGFGARDLAASFLRRWAAPMIRPHGRRTQPASGSYSKSRIFWVNSSPPLSRRLRDCHRSCAGDNTWRSGECGFSLTSPQDRLPSVSRAHSVSETTGAAWMMDFRARLSTSSGITVIRD